MPVSGSQPHPSDAALQLLLFVDRRPSSWEQLRSVRRYLQDAKINFDYDLEVIEVGDKPYLAEHFKLIATPALIKIHPKPQQTLAGSNLVEQLDRHWSRWRRSVEDYLNNPSAQSETEASPESAMDFVTNSSQLMQLSDEVFRLQRENEELQEQLRFKERLISILAHELRNPLTAASLAIETLESVIPKSEGDILPLSPQRMSDLFDRARTQTRLIEKTISDILQASQGESQLKIQPKSLNLGRLCREAVSQQQKRLQAKSLKLKTDIPNDLPRAYADGERIRQVVLNLLDNAIKYTPAEGSIELAILHRTAQKIQVSVSDTGPGIPLENQQTIFEDRFRLQRDRGIEGYGIGLALCQRIVRAHYGQIWVDSVPEKGSCFHFTLPVYPK
ncbi:MAG: histidine kinase [Cyanobacteria bacterium J055]|nr:MAG: histidine kinase [Cyanobacteria bacterium J055]